MAWIPEASMVFMELQSMMMTRACGHLKIKGVMLRSFRPGVACGLFLNTLTAAIESYAKTLPR